MMKLTLEDILEYLLSEDEDADFERRIEDDPDGQRLRDEAEVLLGLLRDRADDMAKDGGTVDSVGDEMVAVGFPAESLADLSSDALDDMDYEPRVNP